MFSASKVESVFLLMTVPVIKNVRDQWLSWFCGRPREMCLLRNATMMVMQPRVLCPLYWLQVSLVCTEDLSDASLSRKAFMSDTGHLLNLKPVIPGDL